MFPALAGISLGVLNSFNVTVEFQGLEVLIALGYVCTAILFVFENRFYTICAQNCEIWKWFRHVWLAGHYIVVAILYSGFLFFIPDQTNLPENVFRRLPCLLRNLYEAPILVIAEDYTYHVIFPSVVSVAISRSSRTNKKYTKSYLKILVLGDITAIVLHN
ncbi:hypothetical protein GCK72_020226 [Caenorhabditis remanei]|uniref:Uncharacterized protein n=1 Tax=Caenorhabditis remanei TaxID=31234 RepID=A0A6A5GGW2_CAERE|nr:hypothetical protein GCK72_020226 [Caenorhabditis remanei]KAF1753669.1 hypothetical protein GCK72_020226 [Caenorhabditis remanei]